jgi:DNA polymerase-1
MINVYKEFLPYKARIIVQVHDELVVLVKVAEADELQQLLINAMGDGVSYEGIPLRVSCHSAGSWAEAKGK